MSCCAASTLATGVAATDGLDDWSFAVDRSRALSELRLAAPSMHCGGCVRSIEAALTAMPGVAYARANLTQKTIAIGWVEGETSTAALRQALETAGFDAFPLDTDEAQTAEGRALRDLTLRMAVAGFASANVMLLSVSVWSGAADSTRDLLHWISALIALPTVLYSGQPFFRSALKALARGRLNMDAPISLAVILAAAASLIETLRGGPEAYFDAAVMLLFLLLVGRLLDRMMRAKARGAAHQLARLIPRGAVVRGPGGARAHRPAAEIRVGDVIELDPGQRAPVDGVIVEGRGSVDAALATGEAAPLSCGPGDRVDAGSLALDAPLLLRASTVGDDTTLAEAARLCAAAEERKSKLARLADQAAAIYAPAVHLIALAAFLGWLALGAALGDAAMIAVAVLIVTCPCALGLAAPLAQAVAAGALFRRGVMLKDGAALERLALVERVMLDKTGVLTSPQLTAAPAGLPADMLTRAAALAARSTHPIAKALARYAEGAGLPLAPAEDISEHAGGGVRGVVEGRLARLGSAQWCGVPSADAASAPSAAGGCWYAEAGAAPIFIPLDAPLRPGAPETVAAFEAAGLRPEILSGDRAPAVAALAERLGVPRYEGGLKPANKLHRVEAAAAGRRPVLMVGDGINDAPALSAAAVSMAPSSAADIGRSAADIVFTGDSLTAVSNTWRMARRTRAVTLQNFALAIGYNCIAVPLAISGLVNPMVAAIAMSASSLVVTLNALRLNGGSQ